ncbi:MAG: hypothetical protein RAO92_02250 [Candidatus Euphemobacter frigidus]|nr:hypothetical protein [Candidatus Euphemobacter frigidus]MDP8275204.1 hypothetical protein [Candidatus Euphemobacter frigidus]
MIVAVAGGKGGVGKTLISTSLARSITSVQFLDCDVEEPNAHIFLQFTPRKSDQVEIEVPQYRKWKGEVCQEGAEFCRYQALVVVNEEMLVFPQLCTSCGGCFILCSDRVLKPMAHQVGRVKMGVSAGGIDLVVGELKVGEQRTVEVIKSVKTRLNRSRNVIIDCPPGNGRPTLEAVRGSEFCLMVTEPTPFGLEDLKGNKQLIDLLGIPAGVVINRSGGLYQEIGRWSAEAGLPILAEVPWDLEIARGAARGRTLQQIDQSWEERLRVLWGDIERLIK